MSTVIEAYVGIDSRWTASLSVVDQGTGRVRLADDSDYTGTETLTAWAGYGDDRASAFDLTATWIDVPEFQLDISGADTADILPGVYRIYMRIASEVDSAARQVALLKLKAFTGTATVAATYCSYDDVKRYCPWIEQVITNDPDMQSDLAEQRARARTWLDEIICNAYATQYGNFGARLPVDASFGGNAGWGGVYSGSWSADKWFRDQLDADCLIVRPWVVEATARYAIYLALENQISEKKGDIPYSTFAVHQCRVASALVQSHHAELDGTGGGTADGYPEFAIPLGVKTAR